MTSTMEHSGAAKPKRDGGVDQHMSNPDPREPFISRRIAKLQTNAEANRNSSKTSLWKQRAMWNDTTRYSRQKLRS